MDWFQFREHQLHKRQEQQQHQQSDSSQPYPESTLKAVSPVETLLASTAVIPRLVELGKTDEIIDILRTYSQLPYVDKEVLVSFYIEVKLMIVFHSTMNILQH